MPVTPNANPSELAKFNQLADDWWNPQGPMQPLHDLNPIRCQYIQDFLPLKSDTHLLDVGCGGGLLTTSLAEQGYRTTGIDLNPALIKVARQEALARQLMIDYRCIAVEELATEYPESFDGIACLELLEHVPDPAKMIHDCAQLVKPGGKLFFATIHRSLKAFLGAILGAEYLLGLLPRGTHTYQQFIKPAELIAWASAAHLELVDLSGMRYNPFTRQASLNRDVAINYLCCFNK